MDKKKKKRKKRKAKKREEIKENYLDEFMDVVIHHLMRRYA